MDRNSWPRSRNYQDARLKGDSSQQATLVAHVQSVECAISKCTFTEVEAFAWGCVYSSHVFLIISSSSDSPSWEIRLLESSKAHFMGHHHTYYYKSLWFQSLDILINNNNNVIYLSMHCWWVINILSDHHRVLKLFCRPSSTAQFIAPVSCKIAFPMDYKVIGCTDSWVLLCLSARMPEWFIVISKTTRRHQKESK